MAGVFLFKAHGSFEETGSAEVYRGTLSTLESAVAAGTQVWIKLLAGAWHYALSATEPAEGAYLPLYRNDGVTPLTADDGFAVERALQSGVTVFLGSDSGVGNRIVGGTGKDTITGGAGDDTITGGGDADKLSGGGGDDTFHATAGDIYPVMETIDGGTGTDTLTLHGGGLFQLGTLTIANLERIRLADDATSSLSLSAATIAAGTSFEIDADAIGGAAAFTLHVADYGPTANFVVTSRNAASASITTGDGNDRVTGSNGNDTINAGSGNDVVRGDADASGTGVDKIVLGVGSDTVEAWSANIDQLAETIEGGPDDHLALKGGGSFDLRNATIKGIDYIDLVDDASYVVKYPKVAGITDEIQVVASALSAAHTLTFDGSADDRGSSSTRFVLQGGAGADTVTGGSGSDTLKGGDGADVIHGGDGSDSIYGGAGADFLSGGDGQEFFSTSADDISTLAETIDGGANENDTLWLQGGTIFDLRNAIITGIERIQLSGSATGTVELMIADAATAASARMSIDAQSLNSSTVFIFDGGVETDGILNITGGYGKDSITGGAGNDSIRSSTGDDTLSGGAGNDMLDGADGADSLSGGVGDDMLTTNEAGLASDDTLDGGEGTDVLFLDGGGTFDVAAAVASGRVRGIEMVYGSYYADMIIATAGDDTLTGYFGDDRLTGGTGADTFLYVIPNPVVHGYGDPNGADTITDFGTGNDRITLAAGTFAGGTVTEGDGTDVAARSVRIAQDNGNTILSMDIDGVAGAADLTIVLEGAYTTDDFRLEGDSIVYAFNRPPVLGALDGDTVSYTLGTNAALLDQGAPATVTDADAPASFAAGNLIVSFADDSRKTGDVLGVLNQGDATGQIGVANGTVRYEGRDIGTLSGGTGADPLVITFTSGATPQAVQALVRAIAFANADPAGAAGDRKITVSLTDDKGGTGAPATVTVRAARAPVTPSPPPDPTSPTNVIGGVPVETRTETDGTGKPVQVVTVPTVPTTRPDTGAPVASIDVPLVKAGNGTALLAAELPAGFGLRVEGPSGGPQSPQQALADLTEALGARSGDAGAKDLAADFLNGLSADTQIILRTIVPSVPAGTTQAPGQPLVISAPAGTTGTREALVLDLRNLPPGTAIELQNIEFAVIVGDARVTGGNGSQTVTGDGKAQIIVLGADDDVLHGGAGDDVVGSKGGDDQLYGDEGNDRLFGGEGNDTLDGGGGVDAVRVSGTRAQNLVTERGHAAVTITALQGLEGIDTLQGVEILRFDDGVTLANTPAASMLRFEEGAYLARNPDVAAAVARGDLASGAEHFQRWGAGEGRGDVFVVDEAFYRAQNPDVDAAITAGRFASAAAHFALYGLKEGRDPSAFFATGWYLARNTDVAEAVWAGATTAYEHYSARGWKEGRDASVWFDTTEYLARNADVAGAGVNPLSHLLDFGLREGRLAYANDTGLWG